MPELRIGEAGPGVSGHGEGGRGRCRKEAKVGVRSSRGEQKRGKVKVGVGGVCSSTSVGGAGLRSIQ